MTSKRTSGKTIISCTLLASLLPMLWACGGGSSSDAPTADTASAQAEQVAAADVLAAGKKLGHKNGSTTTTTGDTTTGGTTTTTGGTTTTTGGTTTTTGGTTTTTGGTTTTTGGTTTSTPAPYLKADPAQSYASINAVNLQYMNTGISPSAINESTGLAGNSMDGLMNFQKVADPADSTRGAYLFQIAKRDPGTSKRTEIAWGSQHGYTIGQTYWQAFRVRLGDNIRYAPGSDESVIWQVHDNSTEDLNPNMSLIAQGGGRMVLWLKYASSNQPSLKANAVARKVYDATYASNQWVTFVVQFKPHYASGKGAFFKLWRDGQLVVNDTLPNDYNSGQESDPNRRSYQKHGLYHYYDDQWTAGESRTMYSKGLVTFEDDGKLSEPVMRALIEAR